MRYILTLMLLSHLTFCKPLYFKKFTPSSSISVLGGAAGYFGDITPFKIYLSNGPQSIKHATGFEFSRNFKKNFNYRINLNYIKLEASDKYYDTCAAYRPNYIRNLNFKANVLETSASLQYEIERDGIVPYFFAGVGHIMYNVNKQSIKNSISIPFGIGVKTRISKRIEVAAELNYRYTVTDALDDVLDSRIYKQVEKPFIMNGNDLYYTAQLKVTYRIPVKIRCYSQIQTVRYKIN